MYEHLKILMDLMDDIEIFCLQSFWISSNFGYSVFKGNVYIDLTLSLPFSVWTTYIASNLTFSANL